MREIEMLPLFRVLFLFEIVTCDVFSKLSDLSAPSSSCARRSLSSSTLRKICAKKWASEYRQKSHEPVQVVQGTLTYLTKKILKNKGEDTANRKIEREVYPEWDRTTRNACYPSSCPANWKEPFWEQLQDCQTPQLSPALGKAPTYSDGPNACLKLLFRIRGIATNRYFWLNQIILTIISLKVVLVLLHNHWQFVPTGSKTRWSSS